MARSGLTVTADLVDRLKRNVTELTGGSVYVGVPADEAARDDDSPIDNAAIGYIMENGSPEANVPARPHLVPGVRAAGDEVALRLRAAALAATDPTTSDASDEASQALHGAGLAAVNSVRALIVSKIAPTLAESTVDARRRRHGRKEAEEGDDGETPLIDTGDYIKHITYVVTE